MQNRFISLIFNISIIVAFITNKYNYSFKNSKILLTIFTILNCFVMFNFEIINTHVNKQKKLHFKLHFNAIMDSSWTEWHWFFLNSILSSVKDCLRQALGIIFHTWQLSLTKMWIGDRSSWSIVSL